MLLSVKYAIYSEIHTKHINALHRQNIELLNAQLICA